MRMDMRFLLPLLIWIFLFCPFQAIACDLCAIYTADEIKSGSHEGFSVSLAEQFTSFHALQNNGDHVENNAHQSLSSSVTQIVGRYNFSADYGLQMALPLISRNFKRPEGGEIHTGSESGAGDMSIVGFLTPVSYASDDFLLRLGIKLGIKLPTGDSDRLREETEEEHEEEEHFERASLESSILHAGHEHSDEIESGVHGHDLALGSGSTDYILGWSLFVEKARVFAAADMQYIFRTEGDFDYRYQNDLLWDTGLGSYLYLTDERSVSLKANLSGEYKGMDIFDGNKAKDTGVNSMFLGPELIFTEGNSVQLHAGVDLPLFVDNTALQIVPEYRFRVGLTYRF